MPLQQSFHPNAQNRRRLAARFTPNTPHHHPLLDPNFPQEDVSLVPRDLAPRGHLNWDLPRKAVTNLHICLKLSNKADEFLEDFHEKLSEIDEVLTEWVEMHGSSPTTTGEAHLRELAYIVDHNLGSADGSETAGSLMRTDGTVFNMVSSPGRADVIYLTDGIDDDETSPLKLPKTRWQDFDGSYLEIANAAPQAGPQSAVVQHEHDYEMRQTTKRRWVSTPSNLRLGDWPEANEHCYLPSKTYNPPAEAETGMSGAEARSNSLGPYELFWLHHDPCGYGLASNDDTATNP